MAVILLCCVICWFYKYLSGLLQRHWGHLAHGREPGIYQKLQWKIKLWDILWAAPYFIMDPSFFEAMAPSHKSNHGDLIGISTVIMVFCYKISCQTFGCVGKPWRWEDNALNFVLEERWWESFVDPWYLSTPFILQQNHIVNKRIENDVIQLDSNFKKPFLCC